MKTAHKKLQTKREAAELGGEPSQIKKQHNKGKLSARERIDILLDKDSFFEIDMFVQHRCYDFNMHKDRILTDRVITGYGTIDNRKKFSNPYIAAERGYIDDVIIPNETRSLLNKCLSILETKVDSNPKKKYGNIPL